MSVVTAVSLAVVQRPARADGRLHASLKIWHIPPRAWGCLPVGDQPGPQATLDTMGHRRSSSRDLQARGLPLQGLQPTPHTYLVPPCIVTLVDSNDTIRKMS